MNTIGYFEIQSCDPSRDIVFYKNVFGWKFIRENNVAIEYYRIETSSINGGLLKRPAKVPSDESGTNAFVCSIEVDNFDTTQESILKNGGQSSISEGIDANYFDIINYAVFALILIGENVHSA